jgi:hypothetical protein
MSDQVFICYAREDAEFALRLARALQARGVAVWIDQWSIPKGADWDRAIDDALYACSHVLIVLSPEAVESNEVRAELRTAFDENKRVVPVLHRPARVPRRLRLLQLVDLSAREPDDDSALTEVLEAIGGRSAGPVREDPAPARGPSPPPPQTRPSSAASQQEVTVVALGAAGHGKRTLAAAVQRYQDDRLGRRIVHIVPARSNRAGVRGGVLVVAANDGPLPGTREDILFARQSGARPLAVFLSKTDTVDDPELVELIELEIRELLKNNGFPGDDIPIVRGNALAALDDPSGRDGMAIRDLLSALDSALPRTR